VDWPVGGIVTVVAVKGGIFDTGKDEEEENGHAHAGGCQIVRTGCFKARGDVLHENMDMNETWCRVRGNDNTIPINIAMTENTTVHWEWSESVLRILAPVRTWNPMSRMLLASNMNAENA
jgi:hypothetical protein